MRRHVRDWLLLTAAGAALVSACGPAVAQTASDEATLGEVVVTGLRREATVQNTAAVISVLDNETLERAGVAGAMQLQFNTPGVLISQDQLLSTQIFIRGIGSNLLGIATSNSVATYVDGVYIANPLQAGQSFGDIERVEVLKGPQATLYGRNATGGAINVVSMEPSFDFGGNVSAAVGNYNAWRVKGGVTGELVEDRVAGRLAVQFGGHQGYGKNLLLGTRVLGERTWGLRGALKVKLTEDLEAIIRADYLDQRTSDFNKLFPCSAVYFIGIPQFCTSNAFAYYGNLNNKNPLKDRGVSGTLRWDTPLGRVTSVSSYRMFKAGPSIWDADNVPVGTLFFPFGAENRGTIIKSNTFYHETYLSTDDQRRLTAIVGANYFNEDALEDAVQAANIPPLFTGWNHRVADVEAWSVFADLGFQLTDELKIVGGVRYSEEEKHYATTSMVPPRPRIANSATFTNTSPRIGVEYRPMEGLLVYATATSGFKSGGFNQNFANNAFDPEKIVSYEAGFKSRPLGGRARLNASAFYYDYKDIQVTQAVLFNGQFVSRVTNAGTAKLWGLDVESSLLVIDSLTLSADASLLHSEFGSALFCDPLMGTCSNPCDPGSPDFATCPPERRAFFNVKGNKLPRAPELTANLSFDYRPDLGLPGTLSIRGQWAYRSRTYYTVFENPIYSTGPFWMVDGSVRYEDPKGWFVEAYGNNLTDKLAITGFIASAPLRNPTTGALLAGTPACFCRYAAPRTYGLRVGYEF